MKLWTEKFIVALVFLTTFIVDATWLGQDPYTARPRHLIPLGSSADSGPASFIFLLAALYVLSHSGGWVWTRLRTRGQPEPEREKKPKRRKR